MADEKKKPDWREAAAALMAADPRWDAAFSSDGAAPSAPSAPARQLSPAELAKRATDLAILDGIPDAPNKAQPMAAPGTPAAMDFGGGTGEFTPTSGAPVAVAPGGLPPTVMQAASGNMQLPVPQPGVPPLATIGQANTAQQNQALALAANTKGAQQDANTASAGVDSREAQATQPILNRTAEAQALATKGIAAAHEKAFAMSQEIIGKWKEATDQMTKIAQAKPYDFWSTASGFDKFRAGLSIALGVIGGMRDGSNAGVERIDQLIAQEHAKQKSQFELWGKVAIERGNQYGSLVNMLGNERLADTAFTQTLRETAKSQIEAMSNRFSSDRAKTKAQQLNAGLDAAGAKTFQEVNQTATENAINLQKQQIEQENTHLRLRAQNEGDAVPIEGILGGVPKTEHEKLSAEAGGARALINVLNTAEDMLSQPGGIDLARKYLVNSTSAFKGARDYIGTGTRIEAGEQSILDQYTPGAVDSFISKYTGDANGFRAKLHAAKVDVAGGMFTKIHTAAPTTSAPDLRDPIWGDYLHEYLTAMVQHHLRARQQDQVRSAATRK